MKSKRPHFTHSDRRLLAACVLAVAILASGAWLGGLHRLPADTTPPVQLPKPNAYDTWTAARKAYVPPPKPAVDEIVNDSPNLKIVKRHVVNRTYPPAARDAWLARNATTLALLRQGLKQTFYQPVDPMGLSFIWRFRPLAHLLEIESHSRALRGDSKGAADCGLDIVEIGIRSIPGAGQGGVVAAASTNALGFNVIWENLPHLDAVGVNHVLRRLQRIDAERTPLSLVLADEKSGWHRQLIGFMKSGQFGPEGFTTDNDDKDITSATRLRWKLADYSQILRDTNSYWDRGIATADRPYSALAIPPIPEQTLADPVTCQLAIQSHIQRFFFQAARDSADVRALLLVCALQSYKDTRGTYPASLSALAPQFVKAVPPDPFGRGGPFLYRRQGANYLLYSIGPDGRDDGGRPIVYKNNRSETPSRHWVQQDAVGDMVAGINTDSGDPYQTTKFLKG